MAARMNAENMYDEMFRETRALNYSLLFENVTSYEFLLSELSLYTVWGIIGSQLSVIGNKKRFHFSQQKIFLLLTSSHTII